MSTQPLICRESGNVWAQEQTTGHLDGAEEIAERPTWASSSTTSDSGNLVVALGIQGVLVGTPEGQWAPIAVGRFTPTDFSFSAKTGLLLSDLGLWIASLALSLSMTGAALLFAQNARSAAATIMITMLGILSVLASSLFMLLTIGSENPEEAGEFSFHIYSLLVVGVPAYVLGILSMFAFFEYLRYWAAVLASLVGMNALVFLAFMLWLHTGIALLPAEMSSIVLTAIVAFLLGGYLKRRKLAIAGVCQECQRRNEAWAQFCANCGQEL